MEWTRHAETRCAQRAVPRRYVQLALDWGTPVAQKQGRTAYHLGVRDAQRARLKGAAIPERALGVIVVVSRDEVVVTVVRSTDRSRLRMAGGRFRRGRRRGN